MTRVAGPLEPATPPTRLAGLDILRGVAALAVCLFHWEHIAFQTRNDEQVFRCGLLGVELFFLISGFVILMVAERTASVQGFLWARVLRLYPVYLISVALTAIYVLITGKFDLRAVLLNATMLQSFIGVPNITNPYWTLAFEISFYAMLAAVLRLDIIHRIEWLSCAWLVVAAAYRIALPGWMTFDPQHPFEQASYIVAAPQFAPFFILGMLSFRARRGQLRGPGLAAAAGALLLTLQGRGDFAHVSGLVYAGFTCMSLCALAILVRTSPQGLIARTMREVGVMSYPLYLLHCTLANLCVYAFHDSIGTRVAVLVSVPISLASSFLIHHCVEVPIARFSHRGAARQVWTVPVMICPSDVEPSKLRMRGSGHPMSVMQATAGRMARTLQSSRNDSAEVSNAPRHAGCSFPGCVSVETRSPVRDV